MSIFENLTVKTSLDDPLIIAKLPFLSYVVGIVEPFMKLF